jgi:hypothetical protein
VENIPVSAKRRRNSNLPSFRPLTVATDGRHGQRKNTKNSNVAAIGIQTGYTHSYVSAEDDSCSQRHEIVGTEIFLTF